MQTWNVTLASASGHISFTTAIDTNAQERLFAQGIGLAKLATIRNLEGEVHLQDPNAPEAEDQRGELTPYDAYDLLQTWAGA